MQHWFCLGVHQDRAGVLVDEIRDGPDVVYVRVGNDYGPYFQVRLLYRERDAGSLVAGIDESANP